MNYNIVTSFNLVHEYFKQKTENISGKDTLYKSSDKN
jgi:hypothetical protein